MPSMPRLASVAVLLVAGSAAAQPAGDPAPGSSVPLVLIVNLMNGVKARDAVTGTESDWSVVDGFNATSYDPWGC